MTPPIACARSPSAMTSMSGSSARSTPSRVRSFSPAFARRMRSARPASLRVVERVGRLAHLEHHVVGDVDDRADAAHAARLEPIAHPLRRVTGRTHFEHLRAVARAQLGVLDRDLDRLRLPGRRHRPIRELEREAVRRRGLARQADHAEAIGTVRGDLEVDDRLTPVTRTEATSNPRRPSAAATSLGIVRARSRARDSQRQGSFTAGTAPGTAGRSRRTAGCPRLPI